MTERPIIFSAPMVRAILEGRKTQTRRVLKPQPFPVGGPFYRPHPKTAPRDFYSVSKAGTIANIQTVPYAVGDRLWVREAWQYAPQQYCSCPQGAESAPCDDWSNGTGCASNRSGVIYRVDGGSAARWRPSIHMPRWASRITLEVTAVKVERLQEISEEDAKAEGVEPLHGGYYPYGISTFMTVMQGDREVPAQYCPTAKNSFHMLWKFLHGPGAWEANPWVVAIEFKRAA